jgi:predicted acyl esterase
VAPLRRSLVLGAIAGLLAASVGVTPAAAAPRAGSGAPALLAHGSVRQVDVTGAAPGAALQLVDADQKPVARGSSDSAGALLFRDVPPGRGYRVVSTDGTRTSLPVRVLRPDQHPPADFYRSQQLGPGYGYLTTRDGTRLAVNVRLPGPADAGPYPTVVEYSGYDPANPDSNQPAMRLAQTLGYATVGVNLRGTGCSGGVWEYFDELQALDGYDAIEVIAAQPWVAHGRVGMVGISYSGITQLFVAATRPPHLAAIAPVSVISDTYRGVLYPGGILNTGFAVPWAEDRQSDARPAPAGGQGWAKRRVRSGDATCAANQALRGQTPNVLTEIHDNEFLTSRLREASPTDVVGRIRVPTFLAGTWQDEETGGYWPSMIDHFDPRVRLKVTMTNGTHADPFGPAIITRWAEFLDFYVARRIPMIPPSVRANAARGYQALAGTPIQLPPDRFAGQTDYGAALARYEAEPPVRVLFDNGAGAAPGAPVPAFEASFDRWPVARTRPWRLTTGAGGTLSDRGAQHSGGASDHYRYDPTALPATDHPSHNEDLFGAHPSYDWSPLPTGLGAGYVSAPLRHDVVVLGPASADLWLRSSAPDTDLEVVITEVRPDGQETYVQSGWLRASHRALDRHASSELAPVQTHVRRDAADLPAGRFTLVRVPIFPFGHVFRAGSRVRMIVQPPGGNRPSWAFDALRPRGPVTDEIAHTPKHASSVVLSEVRGISVPTPLPPCGALRSQPCRRYVPTTTGG